MKEKENIEYIRLETVDSTNTFLKTYRSTCSSELTIVTSDYQISGKGQTNNHWESENGKNLLFSIKLYPTSILAAQQFIISQTIAISIKEVLMEYNQSFSIKWPNDIYWNEKKIAGILIENEIIGQYIENSIIGIGININQLQFKSNAPNPISLYQITGKEENREDILNKIIDKFQNYYELIKQEQATIIRDLYKKSLFHKDGFHSYKDKNGDFKASIENIELNGQFILRDNENKLRSYFFKEVQFVMDE